MGFRHESKRTIVVRTLKRTTRLSGFKQNCMLSIVHHLTYFRTVRFITHMTHLNYRHADHNRDRYTLRNVLFVRRSSLRANLSQDLVMSFFVPVIRKKVLNQRNENWHNRILLIERPLTRFKSVITEKESLFQCGPRVLFRLAQARANGNYELFQFRCHGSF